MYVYIYIYIYIYVHIFIFIVIFTVVSTRGTLLRPVSKDSGLDKFLPETNAGFSMV